MNYRKINNIVGVIVLVIASLVFMLTVEPSTSLWDCGEYIATSNRLEVGHPPGAPTFMMLGRLISAFSAPENAAYMVNILSALSSALTILFLFWTITHLARKVVMTNGEEASLGDVIAVMGAGLVGSFCFMFSDSFWFSAEEGEVYAMSVFFTSITFWTILKWEENHNKISADRWIILLFFLVGISVGVHLLNLLVIPAAAFVYYFKKYEFTIKGFILTGVISIAILGFLNSAFIPLVLKSADAVERSFSGMGFGFNTGAFFFFFLIFAILGFGTYYFHKNGMRLFHTITVAFTVLIIGFSTFAMIVVRSNSNPPLDENNPETIPALMSYFGREQYGDWPLLYGHQWNSPAKQNTGEVTGKKYFKAYTTSFKGKKYSFGTEYEAREFLNKSKLPNLEIKPEYIVIGNRFEQIYPSGNEDQYTMFPRMFDTRKEKIQGYMFWTNYRSNRVGPKRAKYMKVRAKDPKIKQGSGYVDAYLPTGSENFNYFKDYQMGWMYFRYFMWNFAGRQNDVQGHNQFYGGDGMIYKGALTRGNWLSGINFIDKERIGTQDNLPETMKMYEAYNKYYYLPLLLGLLGLVFMVIKAPKDAFTIFLLFFFTGLAIMIYLNPRPYEPRERDYTFAASFYAFAIWIGFGVVAMYKWAMTKDMKQTGIGVISALGAGILFYLIETITGGSHTFSYSILFMAVVGIAIIVIPMFIHKNLKNQSALASLVVGLGLIAPIIMGFQGWDDHDRSNRYFAREIAKNYLNSCDENAILFCFGDNDTFPLWYAQEVEGIRTDMKVMNYSLLSSDWHYNQLKKKTYKAEPVKSILEEPDFRAGTRDIVIISPNDKAVSVSAFVDYMKKGRDQNPRDAKFGYSRVPFNKLYLDVDKEACIRNGLVREDQRNQLVDRIEWTLSGSYISKADLALIDILAAYDWKRPICFTSTAIQGSNRGLSKYLQIEGMTAKFVPIRNPGHNRDKMYPLLMGEQIDGKGLGPIQGFNWGNIEKESVFCDYYTMRMIRSARMHYMQLAESYVRAADRLAASASIDSTGKAASQVKEYREKAVNLLDKQYEVFPIKSCKIDELLNFTAMMYYRAHDTVKGDERSTELANYYSENITYFAKQNQDYIMTMYQEIGGFLNHFEALKQGSGDSKFDIKNLNPDGYMQLVEKFKKAVYDDRDFGGIIRGDINNVIKTRRAGVMPLSFYQDAVPSLLPDADKDGVSDFTDKCPRTPGVIENSGCPQVKPQVKSKLPDVNK